MVPRFAGEAAWNFFARVLTPAMDSALMIAIGRAVQRSSSTYRRSLRSTRGRRLRSRTQRVDRAVPLDVVVAPRDHDVVDV